MLIADLHIHSRYSRATSRDCGPEALDLWARKKGIGLVGTGDFTHPAWRAELREKLLPAGGGLYTLKDGGTGGPPGAEPPRFVVTGEISTIYKKDGRTRKVHSLILLPSLEAAEDLSHRLEAIGNLHSDGRPILGLDCRDLLEITLESCPQAVFVPAHIWTPHFSVFGAFSGFSTLEECFGDLTGHIRALETGLSSDPPMNGRLSTLDGYRLISNSDAHSPSKLGREANLLDIEPSYSALAAAIQEGKGLVGTLEFFPEEGKYHFDGHRNCQQCLSPAETAAAGGLCPVCGRKLTIGVLHRVEELADRSEGVVRPDAPYFESLVPLPEVIAASEGCSAASKRVEAKYERLLHALGPEFYILRQAPLEDVGRTAGPCVMEGIRRLRQGRVERTPGYDGTYGKIQLLDPAEREALNGQVSLFGVPPAAKRRGLVAAPSAAAAEKRPAAEEPEGEAGPLTGLNAEQRAAVLDESRAVAVVAGPGTGKTKTLVSRIAWMIGQRGIRPAEITAVTFTNQAAGEMRARLEQELGKRAVRGLTVGTFHAIALDLLRQRREPVRLLAEQDALAEAAGVLEALGHKGSPRKLLQEVSRRKTGLKLEGGGDEAACTAYAARLKELGALDFDDLLLAALAAAEEGAPDRRFRHLLVDEFQDIDGLQLRLVGAWNREGESLFVIGDPDQSIYGFRGSAANCFAALAAEYPGLSTVRLVQNYRSTPEILGCALPVIGKNPGPTRRLEPNRAQGARPLLVTADSEWSEGAFIAKEIGRMVGGVDMVESDRCAPRSDRDKPWSFGDMAVLYRTHRQAELVEQCLAREGIPCVVAGREDFLSHPRVRAALDFFRRLMDGGVREGEEAWAAHFLPGLGTEKPRRLLEDWAERSGCREEGAVEKLLHTAVFHATMAELLNTLTLGEEGDVRRSGRRRYETGAVTLMTLHGAKGLEFPVVFLCGIREGVLPLESKGRPSDPEEERRLFYVGMTRARDELILLTGREPSPFLADIPAGRVRRLAANGRHRPENRQLSLFDLR